MEKIVDLVAPRSCVGLFFKAAILVSCFTVFDYAARTAAQSFIAQHAGAAQLVTFLIGAPFGLFVMANMTVQHKLKMQLQYLSETDLLTGLPNRNAFFARAGDAMKERGQGAVLMIDVDNFKAINDSFGHYAGDLALAQIGQHLKHTLRPTDIVGRIGGEEFAVVLDASDLETIERVTNRLCTTLVVDARRSADNTLETFDVTFSIGGAVILPGHDLTQSLRHADHALYQAKTNGRDQVVIHRIEDGNAQTTLSA